MIRKVICLAVGAVLLVQPVLAGNPPLLMLGGELANSTASDPETFSAVWPRLTALGLNTVIAPVEWDQIEPEPGKFDFSVPDQLLSQARGAGMHLVILWFGAWKNSMSSYAPLWVKADPASYPRARSEEGEAQDILTPFEPRNLQADLDAFSHLLRHVADIDRDHAVLMVQIENEIGMLPSARDHSPAAERAWNGPVPDGLLASLRDGAGESAAGELWRARGRRTAGTWRDVFGDSPAAQEVFQAWGFAAYVEALAKAGKSLLPVPFYVNAALNRPGKPPGDYPSGGPLPHLFDVWKAAAPDLALLAPDIYFPDFVRWADRYRRPDNAFFIPEANRAGSPDNAANAFYAFGELGALGYSPFAIDRLAPAAGQALGEAYRTLGQLAPLIVQARKDGAIRGFAADIAPDGSVQGVEREFDLGGFHVQARMLDPWKPRAEQNAAAHGGLIVATGPDEFLVAGTGVTLRFAAATGKVGIARITEGRFENGAWIEGRWLNGDESHQGRQLQIPDGVTAIQKIRLYRY